MLSRQDITAWRPAVEGVNEVLHARMIDHVYPLHAHSSWTLLIVDDGMVRYDLDRREHAALKESVTLLPPHVPHNGCSVTSRGFRKRVLYLDSARLGEDLIGLAVDRPVLVDPRLRLRMDQLHACLMLPGEELAAESRLAFICERLRRHLRQRAEQKPSAHDPSLACRLRDLLDERIEEGISLKEASSLLHAHPTHLARAFSKKFGIGPHQYLTGRRVDLARRLLLEGMPPSTVATAVGFYDQSHLARNFKRILGTSPAYFARRDQNAGRSPAP
jgi:AraC-like DNA-binding protein